MKPSRRKRVLDLTAALLIGAGLFALLPKDRVLEGRNDFVHFYIGGLLYGSPDIYSEQANKALQTQLVGGTFKDSWFIRPAFYGLFLKPLTWMPYRVAYTFFQCLNVLCAALFFYWNRRPGSLDLPLVGMMSIPLMSAFINCQDILIALVLCCLSLRLAAKHWDFAAGAVLALCAFKGHLFLLVPLAIIMHRRWRYLLGSVATGVVLALVGLWGAGLAANRHLIEGMLQAHNSPYGDIMPSLRAIAGENAPLFLTLAALAVMLTIYLVRESRTFEEAFAFCLISGVLISFHAYLHDCMLVLFGVVLLYPTVQSKTLRVLLAIAVLPPFYICSMAGRPYSIAFPILILITLAVAAWTYATERLSGALPAPEIATPSPAS